MLEKTKPEKGVFSSFSTFQFDLRSLFFGFESFILRNLRSNSMKNSAIEKKFATLVRKQRIFLSYFLFVSFEAI